MNQGWEGAAVNALTTSQSLAVAQPVELTVVVVVPDVMVSTLPMDKGNMGTLPFTRIPIFLRWEDERGAV